MDRQLICSIASSFVLGLALPLLSFDLKSRCEKLEKSLPAPAQKQFRDICDHQMKNFLWSLLIGAIVGGLVVGMYSYDMSNLLNMDNVCLFLASGLAVTTASYVLMPMEKMPAVALFCPQTGGSLTNLEEFTSIQKAYRDRMVIGMLVGFFGAWLLTKP